MRKLLGTLAGIVTANLTIFLAEALLPYLIADLPPVSRYDPSWISYTPLWVKIYIATSWFLGALVGGFVAFRVARWDAAGWIVGALIAAAGIYNGLVIPHPLWMEFAAVGLPFVGALFAYGLYRRWQRPGG